MDGPDQVGLRVKSMRRGLERARNAIPQVAELDPAFGRRLEVRFGQLASQVERGLEGEPTPAEAAKLLRRGEDLVAETFAFVGGAAARRFGLDDGITTLALAWLDRLSEEANLAKVGVVIPASTEFTGMLTHVVRLKMPSDGIWGLPVAVHEYGHFVASVLARRDDDGGIPRTVIPIERLLHQHGESNELPRIYWHGHELFADALAVAVTGPAHADYCVRYRFDPARSDEITPTHPAPARRMRLQLTVLRALADQDGFELLDEDATRIERGWSERVERAGKPVAPPADPLLDTLEPQLLQVLFDSPELTAIRYGRHDLAGTLAESKLEGPAPETSVAHVLNAAWRVRRGVERDKLDEGARERALAQLTDRATALVSEVLAGA